jgi:hypothetical protein
VGVGEGVEEAVGVGVGDGVGGGGFVILNSTMNGWSVSVSGTEMTFESV